MFSEFTEQPGDIHPIILNEEFQQRWARPGICDHNTCDWTNRSSTRLDDITQGTNGALTQKTLSAQSGDHFAINNHIHLSCVDDVKGLSQFALSHDILKRFVGVPPHNLEELFQAEHIKAGEELNSILGRTAKCSWLM